jgi:hypothetical protein
LKLVKLARTSVAALLSGALIAFAAGCAENNKTENDAKDQTTEERTMAITQGGSTRGGGTRAEKATLEIKGDSGIEFSGSCTVGDEENKISGQAPQSFVYELSGQQLDCTIRKDSAGGNLQLVFTAGGTHAVQQISGGILNLTYDNGMISFSSSGSGGQVSSSSQQVVSSSSQNNSSSSQQVVSSSSQNNSSSISISQ